MQYIVTLLLISGLVQGQSQGHSKSSDYVLPAVNPVAEKNQAMSNKQGPLKYAVSTEISDIYHLKGQHQSGIWQQVNDQWQFKLRLESANATSLNVGMKDFFLPPSAKLWVYTDDESIMRGPYNDSNNKAHGFFWVGDVPGDHMNIKITVRESEKKHLSFNVDNITRGFYRYWEEPSYINKSGSCNVDVACSEGDGWEDEINSLGRYTFSGPSGGQLCTGQMINNTANDGKPYFLTGDHCGYSNEGSPYILSIKQSVAASIALTWNYQSMTCRAPGSSSSGTQISTSGFNDRQSGATYVASNPDSDFSLVLLNEKPLSNYGINYTGWDRTDTAPESAVAIHHPDGHAKRISFENDPVFISSFYGLVGPGDRTHIRVDDWDLGTTEIGSSGSGLWNADHLLIGTLHGGDAACGNDEPDWYGRFYTSWDNGTAAQSRLKDWLDPGDTRQTTLESFAGCEAPNVTIINNSSNSLGSMLDFTAQVSGGSGGGYTYQWDLGGDGGIDGTNSLFQASFSQAFTGNLELTVRDSAGCGFKASKALVIEGADLQIQQVNNIRENLNQLCGNNDLVVDPGERWSSTFEVRNVGTESATSGYLALGKGRGSAGNQTIDNYGNRVGVCNRSFIDISGTGTLYAWEAAGNVNNADTDDEGSVLVQLSQSFDHYGDSINQLRVSTNGFISTSPNATGGDWDNDCPLPRAPDKDNEGARISPMHDDLRGADFYHQFFSVCPRPVDSGGVASCEVFLWQGADLFNTSEVESIDIQAILYPATSQWVYQYDGAGFDGSTSTTGMQNEAATDGLTYACNTANSINTTEAVCTFNKNHQTVSSFGPDVVMLETPVIELNTLNVNQSKTVNMEFAVAEDASCGEIFSFNHEASVHDQGFNAGQQDILISTIGNDGLCNRVNFCGVSAVDTYPGNTINPRDGLWWNPKRSGNGIDLHVTDQSALLYVMYTGNPDRSPIWYIANNAESTFNQYYNDVLQIRYPGGYQNNNQQIDVVGWSNTTFLNNTEAIQVRNIKGELSAEKIIMDQFAADPTPNLHTGHFYSPSENGWGQSIITLGSIRVAIGYIYDQLGAPFWTIASGLNDGDEKTVVTADTFCPHCPALPIDVSVIGTLQMDLNGQTDGIINEYNISYPPESTQPQATWNKSKLSIVNLVPEESESPQ